MEIGSILQRSWDLAWKYKSLWVFGLFIQGLGGFNSAFDLSKTEAGKSFTGSPAFWTLLGVGMVIGLIFLIMHFISSAAHIDAINRLTRGGTYTFSNSFSVGVDNFLRFVGLGLLMLGAVIAVAIVLALPVVLFAFAGTVMLVLGILLVAPIFIAVLAGLIMIYQFAQRAVVVRGSSIGDAIDEAYFLFRTYLWPCIKFALVLLLISVVVGLAILALLGAIALPFVLMALGTDGGLLPALLLGVPLVLAVMFVLDGLLGSFYHSAYTLFYFRLLDIPLQQPGPAVTGEATM